MARCCTHKITHSHTYTHTSPPAVLMVLFSKGQCNTATCCWGISLCCYYTPESNFLFERSSWLINFILFIDSASKNSEQHMGNFIHIYHLHLMDSLPKNLERIPKESRENLTWISLTFPLPNLNRFQPREFCYGLIRIFKPHYLNWGEFVGISRTISRNFEHSKNY